MHIYLYFWNQFYSTSFTCILNKVFFQSLLLSLVFTLTETGLLYNGFLNLHLQRAVNVDIDRKGACNHIECFCFHNCHCGCSWHLTEMASGINYCSK